MDYLHPTAETVINDLDDLHKHRRFYFAIAHEQAIEVLIAEQHGEIQDWKTRGALSMMDDDCWRDLRSRERRVCSHDIRVKRYALGALIIQEFLPELPNIDDRHNREDLAWDIIGTGYEIAESCTAKEVDRYLIGELQVDRLIDDPNDQSTRPLCRSELQDLVDELDDTDDDWDGQYLVRMPY